MRCAGGSSLAELEEHDLDGAVLSPLGLVLDDGLLDDLAALVDDLLVDQRGLAVELGIGEEPSGAAGVVDDVEEELAVVLAHARPASDDLLEVGHRSDHPSDHDVLARRRVDSGGQQLRRRQDHRRHGLQLLESAEVPAADRALVGGHAADVVGELPDAIGVEVVQSAPHLLGVLLVDAEDDRLGERIGPLHEVGEVAGDRLGAWP